MRSSEQRAEGEGKEREDFLSMYLLLPLENLPPMNLQEQANPTQRAIQKLQP